MKQPEFLPTTREEMTDLGWDKLDILLVTGDAYVDSHSFGTSLLGRWLLAHGYKTGIVAQPKWETADDISRMGRPRLFAGVTAGAMDSLLAHYTAFRKKRSQDAYSPGGAIDLRPNRAGIVYAGLIRQAFPGLPVIAGGIEASLRRASHYDFWSDALRRSFVLDSKVDAVLYGMAEKSILALADVVASSGAGERTGTAIAQARLPGTAYAVHPDQIPADAVELPSHEAILADPALLIKATMAFERQMLQGKPCLAQRSGGRAVVFEAPSSPLTESEMDAVYGLPFSRRAHPSYQEAIPAVAMMEGSFVSHRGCGGGCSFCALASHQGRIIQSRSEASILKEVGETAAQPDWKGSVTDIGGPSANMWRTLCAGDPTACARESCLYPKRCRSFKAPQESQIDLLRKAAELDGVQHVRVASGVRHDLALDSDDYMAALVGEFTGGQLKIAPEHIAEKILRLMRKPPVKLFDVFVKAFQKLSKDADKEQYVIPYLMSAFPGTTDRDMEELAEWLRRRGWRPQQVQCFIPTPGTVATAMFYSGQDTEGRSISVARTDADRLRQHRILVPDAEPSVNRRPRDPRFGKREFRRERPERPESGNRQSRPFARGGAGGGFSKREGSPGAYQKREGGGFPKREGGSGGFPKREGGGSGGKFPKREGGYPKRDGGRPDFKRRGDGKPGFRRRDDGHGHGRSGTP